MLKKLFILVLLVVLFGIFNTINTNFSIWKTPSINTDYINSPEFPIGYETDISVLGLVTNFYFQLNNSVDTSIIRESNVTYDFLTSDDVSLEVVTSDSGEEEIILKNVQFTNNSYELDSISKNELQSFSKYLKNQPSLIIAIDGHTDNIGSAAQNKVLSSQRAKSVYDYLLTCGVNENQLFSYNGYGEMNPISTNQTEDGRALNRRTSFRIITNTQTQLSDTIVELENEESVIIKEVSKPVVKKEVSKPVVKKEVSKPVVKKEVSKPVVKREVSKPVDEDLLPSDKEIIQQHPKIKKSAKKIILEALEEGILSMDDVFNLLNKYAGKDLSKSNVKQFIKKKRK